MLAKVFANKQAMLSKCLIWVAVVNFLTLSSTASASPAEEKELLTRPVVKSNVTGGTGGDEFDDTMNGSLLPNITGIHSMTVTYTSQFVESIQVTYLLSNSSLYEAPRHGGKSNIYSPIKVTPASGEYVQKISGKADNKLVNQISITTVYPRDLSLKSYTGPFGAVGEKDFSFEGYFLGVYGQSGDSLDSIGVYQLAPLHKSDWGGGNNSQPFDENPDTDFSLPGVKINKLFIYHGSRVYAIQAEYLLFDGSTKMGKKYGDDQGHTLSVVNFDRDEVIIGVKGTGYNSQVCQLTFVIQQPIGMEVYTYYSGPYGTTCDHYFELWGNMMGFYGGVATDSKSIDRFGIYYYHI